MSFTVVLASSSCTDSFPLNTLSSFANTIPDSDSLFENEADYAVSLRYISFNNRFVSSTPKMYTVKLSEIENVHAAKTSNTSIYTHAFTPTTNRAYCSEVEQPEYRRLSRGRHPYLRIELVDENDKQLDLAYGQTTFVELHIKRMDDEHFMLRLSSDDIRSNGTSSDFHFTFDSPMVLDGGVWEMALTSIMYPNRQRRLLDSNYPTFILSCADSATTIPIRSNDLKSVTSLLEALKRFIKKTFGDVLAIECGDDNRITLVTEQHISLAIRSDLACLMGQSDVDLNSDTHVFTLRYNPNRRAYVYSMPDIVDVNRLLPNTMLVYCDIMKPIIIGGAYSQVLKLVPTDVGNDGGYVLHSCRHLDFVEVSSDHITGMGLKLCKFDGGQVAMENEHEHVLYNILFRRKI